VNSRWNSGRAGSLPALLIALLVLGCGKKEKPASSGTAPTTPVDPAQVEAEQLGREAADLVDRVLAYRSAHQNRLPVSMRQAGLDSLTSQTVRRLTTRGGEPVITVIYRRSAGHLVSGCEGDRSLLEDIQLTHGTFEVACDMIAGGRRTFTIEPPPPPKPAS
jgi:hypothetical protein